MTGERKQFDMVIRAIREDTKYYIDEITFLFYQHQSLIFIEQYVQVVC